MTRKSGRLRAFCGPVKDAGSRSGPSLKSGVSHRKKSRTKLHTDAKVDIGHEDVLCYSGSSKYCYRTL